ncbi:DUF5794 domain-containing protein [Haloglomus irregulare]|jgi:hypothetical protein|uniref:DUF5794 domain-containing protein n=1 Tax=Haloglomus irregulare TaxID=2234134 RepID=UPI00192D4502|nr:DUF5794 domain-containing protein [Haloglomus irregulare]
MSVSRHPIALRLEQHVGRGTRLLATVMLLPLVDGIFPALVLAGGVDDLTGILEVGLLVFGGSATVAVVLAEMDGTRREQVISVLLVGVGVITLAAVEAALAPTIETMLNLETFSRFAALVILAVAAKTASATVGEYLPNPAVIIGLGLVASAELSGASIQPVADPWLVARGAAAGGVGVAFALVVALLGPWLRGVVDLDRFRFGSAVALGVLPLSILELIPANAPLALAVLGITSLLAFDPDGRGEPLLAEEAEGPVAADGDGARDPSIETVDPDVDPDVGAVAPAENQDDDVDHTPGVSDGDRAPWL